MTMFEQLFALACNAALTMTVSADEKSGRLTINVIPKPRQDAGEPALTQALSLSASPQEFDAGFVQALQDWRAVRQSLAQQAEATRQVIEAATAASVKKASDATIKAAKAGMPAPAGAKPLPAATAATQARAAVVDESNTAAGAATTGGEPMDLFA